MERKMNFVSIGLDGKEKSVEKWNHEDVLELLHLLKSKRADLYEVLKNHLAPNIEEGCGKHDMCRESMADERYVTARNKNVISFDSKLQSAQIEALVDLVNELHIFSQPKVMTSEVLAAFFQCDTIALKVRNLRLFCAFMTALANHDFISKYWHAPIYRKQLLLSPQKNGFVNRRDLAFANYAINNVVMDYRIERINHIIRGLMR